MKFTFPDSKHEIELEGLSFLNTSLIRSKYENGYAGKPTPVTEPLDDPNYDSSDATWVAKQKAYNDEKPKREAEFKVWEGKMSRARWAALKSYYATCVVPLTEAQNILVSKQIERMSPYLDLPQSILDGYQELDVPFSPELLPAYIYLFHVCITNAGEQTLFEDAIMAGSGPTQEAVQNTLFRLRR